LTEELRLIRKIQRNGDREAADCLIRLYYDEIFRFERKQVTDEQTALDLTQDIFISMLRTIAHYDRRKAGFRTWLYRIATNKTVDYFRSRAARPALILSIDEVEPIDEADFTKMVEDMELTSEILAYIGRLRNNTQRIFRLHVFGGYTFKQIADDLGIPESSAKTTYYRLIGALRKEFSDYDEQG
jgi:RNA polymerase sigma-70 factor (ECF subfamily)